MIKPDLIINVMKQDLRCCNLNSLYSQIPYNYWMSQTDYIKRRIARMVYYYYARRTEDLSIINYFKNYI